MVGMGSYGVYGSETLILKKVVNFGEYEDKKRLKSSINIFGSGSLRPNNYESGRIYFIIMSLSVIFPVGRDRTHVSIVNVSHTLSCRK